MFKHFLQWIKILSFTSFIKRKTWNSNILHNFDIEVKVLLLQISISEPKLS